MNEVTEYKDSSVGSVAAMWEETVKVIPSILAALVVLILGWLFAKIVVGLVRKGLKLAKADKLDDKLNQIEIIEGKKLKFDTVKIVSKFVKWVSKRR